MFSELKIEGGVSRLNFVSRLPFLGSNFDGVGLDDVAK